MASCSCCQVESALGDLAYGCSFPNSWEEETLLAYSCSGSQVRPADLVSFEGCHTRFLLMVANRIKVNGKHCGTQTEDGKQYED